MRFKTWFRVSLAAMVVAIGAGRADAINDLLAYWNFNGFNITAASPPGMNGAPTSIAANLGAGNLDLTPYLGNLDDFTGTLQNAPAGQINEDAFGFITGASLIGNGKHIQMSVDMTGKADLGVSFSTQRTSTGFNSNQLSYSINGGVDFFPFGSPVVPQDVFSIQGPILAPADLNGVANVLLRYTFNGSTNAGGNNRLDNLKVTYNSVAAPPPAGPTLPQPGDIVLGMSVNNSTQSTEIARGPVTPNGGVYHVDPWTTPFVQSMEFDNFEGQSHNVRGNLIGVDFGASATGGQIYSMPTNGSTSGEGGTLIGNTKQGVDAIGHTGGVSLSRLSGVSVSPENDKIAVVGTDTATVIVYGYTPGDTTGDVPAPLLMAGRQTETTNPVGSRFIGASTQGTAWRDNNTVIVASQASGKVHEVETTIDVGGTSDTALDTQEKLTLVTDTLDGPIVGGLGLSSPNSSVAYNPEISPYLYVSMSGFTSGISSSFLYVVSVIEDIGMPGTFNYSQVGSSINLSTSSQTARELALDADGNLFIGGFDSTISYLPASNFVDDTAVAAIADNSSIFWYQSPNAAVAFTGMDIGMGEASVGLEGDHNGDGVVDAADYVAWRKDPANFGGDPGGYNAWVANFGEGGPGSGGGAGNGAVPEPASLMLVAVGVAALAFRRSVA